MTTLRAPFTPEQVAGLNVFQKDGRFHPFTCPGDRAECRVDRDLVATPTGLVCPCGEYKQDWAHSWMALPPENWPGLP